MIVTFTPQPVAPRRGATLGNWTRSELPRSAFVAQWRCSMTTATSNSAPDLTATSNPLAQLRAARREPIAAIIGATAGLVPVGVYEVGHHELSPPALMGTTSTGITGDQGTRGPRPGTKARDQGQGP